MKLSEHRGLVILAALVAVAGLLWAVGVRPDLPDAEKVIEDLAKRLGKWTYLLVGALAYLETGAFVGLVAPGESAVIVGGVVAGQGEISLVLLIGIVWVAAVLGDTTSFFIGRRLGRSFIVRHGPKLRIDEERLAQVESYFERHGGKTILIGRFIGLVRALAPFVAGSSGLPYRRFVPFSIIGCGLWSTVFCVLGYVFWQSFDQVTAIAGKATLAFGLTVALAFGAVMAYRRLRDPEQRRVVAEWIERQGQRPWLRPLYAAGRPGYRVVLRPAALAIAGAWAFVSDRLGPGELGLQLTTALATIGVGLYVFVLYVVTISSPAKLTPADRELLDLADDLRTGLAVDVLKVVTELGSTTVVMTVIFVTVVGLWGKARRADLIALVVGAVSVYTAVQLAKAGVDRERPPRPLVETGGESFPSGHAALSVLWVGAALVWARAMEGRIRAALVVGVAIGIAAVVGLSRIYLRAHYWSDVAAGWGLAAGLLGLCAAGALIVPYFRNNAGEA